jgi:hypothetical protein
MNHRSSKSNVIWLQTGIAALLIAAAIYLAQSFPAAQAASETAATYSQGTLHLSIPYNAPRAATGQLTLELLSPEDAILARAERRITVAQGLGSWNEDLKLAKPLPTEDLVWHRVRYRFDDGATAPIQGTESISQILRTPVIHILGQQSYLAGGEAAVRLIVTDSKNEAAPAPSTVRIDLITPDAKTRRLYAGPVNRRGTVEAQFRFPAGLAGPAQLHYVAETPIGATEFTQSVKLQEKASILLTTEKPIYQPGQTIHVRALSLDRANHEATAARKLLFEVEDSRGNKVYKKDTATDSYGVASAEFALADEVNLGTYHLRAVMGENRAEIALNVERYVLPKFKVALEFNGAAKHGYRPGDHVTGIVRANYFFGKPVDGEVTVKASSMDVAVFEPASAQGKMDADGAYRFDLKLPNYFAGRPLSQGAARVLIEASVKDTAAHSETRGEPIVVSESPLLITAVPEGGTLVPNLENQVFILTSYADGKPASADIQVRDQRATTDAGGVAVVRIKAGAAAESLKIQARDRDGNRAETTVNLQPRDGSDQILLRTEHAIYKAGDSISLHVLSTKERGTAYVDVVKDGQTILTRDLDIVNGRADLAIPATPDLAGTVDINAYLFGRNAIPVSDHRLLFVQPADELKIETTTDAQVYKPGDDARIRFRVTNSHGEGVQAALGLQVVDEAVFALAEKQPGFAKVFFYLEQEALKPRYEIHSIGMSDAVEAKQDQSARALFAATEAVNTNRFQTEVGRAIPMTKYGEYYGRYHAKFIAQAREIASHYQGGELTPAVRDSWGEKFNVTKTGQYFILRSAGPDRQLNSSDDLAVYLEVRPRTKIPTGLNVKIEHDRGPFNGLAELTGSLAEGTVLLRNVATAKTRIARPNTSGDFNLSGLPAGEYDVEVTTGSEKFTRKLTLEPRDRAVLNIEYKTIRKGSELAVMDRIRFGGNAGFGGGFGGGVIGGIIGGMPAGRAMREEMAMPMAAPPAKAMMAAASNGPANTLTLAKDKSAAAPEPDAPRVRSYFPEALYINPEIVTAPDGRASIVIPIADSITTWRMALIASTKQGALGTGTAALKVFQDFFVDLDLPVTLTQGDRVSLPIAAYNYSGAKGDISLDLKQDDWFTLVNDTANKQLAVEAGRVGGSQYTIEAKRIGKFKLTLSAKMAGAANRADIVVREIEVIPNGREQNQVFNGRLETTANHALTFPSNAIDDAGKVYVRLYPGPLSQVVEGMDAILRMPGGCFEQTSSSTYPNVLALDYMKSTKKLTPEVHAKAEGFIANGYQRLLTFEVPGGGFSWFGQAPANKILTSYGLMEFADMAKVYDVDPKVIQRTQEWLASQQQPDGSWKPDTYFINEGATNRFNSDVLRITAYVAWALGNTGYQGPAVEKAKQFIEGHLNGKLDAYTVAVLANFATDYGKDRAFTSQVMQRLLDARTEKDEQAFWTPEETGVYSTGNSAAVETTGLAIQGLLKWGGASGTATKALAYIASKKDASGTWGTTQATIMALRALLLSTSKGAADVQGTVEITLDGKPVQTLQLTAANNDLLHQYVFKSTPNNVALRFTGKGALAYQVVARSYVPWDAKPANEPLSITVNYDRDRLAQDDIATVTATVKNNLNKVANMVMIDLGIPPGFDLLTEDLQSFQEKTATQKGGKLEKFSMTATQAILYFDAVNAQQTVTLKYRLRAKYPIRAKTFQSRVYEYYDPDVNATARPVQLEVRKK